MDHKSPQRVITRVGRSESAGAGAGLSCGVGGDGFDGINLLGLDLKEATEIVDSRCKRQFWFVSRREASEKVWLRFVETEGMRVKGRGKVVTGLKGESVGAVSQLEEGEGKAQLHSHTFFHSRVQMRYGDVMRLFGSGSYILAVRAESVGRVISYCCKKRTRVAGPWSWKVRLDTVVAWVDPVLGVDEVEQRAITRAERRAAEHRAEMMLIERTRVEAGLLDIRIITDVLRNVLEEDEAVLKQNEDLLAYLSERTLSGRLSRTPIPPSIRPIDLLVKRCSIPPTESRLVIRCKGQMELPLPVES